MTLALTTALMTTRSHASLKLHPETQWDKIDGENSTHILWVHTYKTTIIELVIVFGIDDEVGL